MRATVLLPLLVLASSASADPEAEAEPAPAATMMRVEFREASPETAPGSPRAPSRTLYRLGRRHGRLEHPPEADGTHAVVIVSEPHMWVIDRARGEGAYRRDPGPSFVFRAPVFRPGTVPAPLLALEFGREFEFVEALGATPVRAARPDGTAIDRYTASLGSVEVVLDAATGTRRALALGILHQGQLIRAYAYDRYDRDLPPDPALFRPPEGVQIRADPAQ